MEWTTRDPGTGTGPCVAGGRFVRFPEMPQLRLRGCRMAHGWLPSWPVTDTDRSVTTTHAPEAQEGASLSHAIANTGVVVPLVHAAAGYLRVTRFELFI